MSVSSLDVHPRTQSALRKARIIKIADLLSFTRPQLERKLNLPSRDVAALLNAASLSVYRNTAVTLLTVYNREASIELLHFKCTTECPVIDRFLKGGLLVPGITEISGESSAGKTQLCLQFCLSCQLPKSKSGLESAALYISTEDAFPVKRLKQMAGVFYDRHRTDLRKGPMDNIFIEHAGDLEDLWHILRKKIKTLLCKGAIKLIVIDSIAALFRVEFDMDDIAERSHALVMFGKELVRISREYCIAVVCVNQVSDVIPDNDGAEFKRKRNVKPALGLTWSYMVTTRILLSRTTWNLSSLVGNEISEETTPSNNEETPSPVVRAMKILFAPHLNNEEIYFFVDENGVHGVNI